MKRFKILNNSLGWLIFLVAAFTYCLTVEPTASFWDCPEFILSGNKLEVGHPPGAPFFMLTANFFSMFAGPAKVALMVNIMSAILSALGILFLFWSITHLVRKLIVGNSQNISAAQTITILASGAVGALAYTWSDTYWFSAVEGEVYGYSSLFTAVVFWLILKWEDNATSPHSDRWLILIAYLVGLSIGVHLLNLLCIPAIVLVIYYKKFPNANWKGTLVALLASSLIVFAVLYGVVPGVVKVGGWFELLFVNVLGMPFNSGLLVYLILLFGALITGIVLTEKGKSQKAVALTFTISVALLGIPFYGHGSFMSIFIGLIVLVAIYFIALKRSNIGTIGKNIKNTADKYLVSLRAFNTSFLCMLLIMIGYSSYALIVIRSSANTPMDQNSPEDIFTLGTYLNREQYGTRPLLWGQGFDSEFEYDNPTTKTGPVYTRVEKRTADEPDRYEISDSTFDYNYVQNMLFPRMYSRDHASLYEQWVGTIDNVEPAKYGDRTGKGLIKVPTFGDNMRFFFRYQVNHMYWRYFLWNFVGRQNDIQGNGEIEYGNWITGIPFIDGMLVGDQESMPTELKENKGRNVFFALPLILGIIGLVWQLTRGKKGKQQFWIVFMLFFMTGLAIVLYLNQTPNQPRERDYAYAGSFYAFAIWIGMGVAGIAQLIKRLTKTDSIIANSLIAAACLAVPVQMVSQTWDDHDRSGRYACRDFGQNYLNTLPDEGCPIIFTCGDNDTFPLWYNQEVEGVRTDARVCNLSYLQTDWYIDQMKRPAYDSPSLPITWERINYAGNRNYSVYVLPEMATGLINEYAEQHPDEMAVLGNDCFDMNVVTKHWILETGTETKERRIVENIIGYLKSEMPRRIEGRMKQLEQEYSMFMSQKQANESVVQKLNDEYNTLLQAEHLIKYASKDEPVIPAEVHIPIDKEAVKRSGMRIPEIYDESRGGTMPERMVIPLNSSQIYRKDLIILDMLANANWERPIYMSMTVGTKEYPAVLQNYFQHEGLAFRITPFDWTVTDDGYSDIDKFYNNVMNRFKWGGIKNNKNYYADETILRMIYTHRSIVINLAHSMLVERRPYEDIFALLEKLRTEIPCETIPYNAFKDNSVALEEGRPSLLGIYTILCNNWEENADNKEAIKTLKARKDELAESVTKNEYEHLLWYSNLDHSERNSHMVSLRIANLNRIFSTLGCEKIGNISKRNVIGTILEILKAEKEHIDDYATKLTKKRLKNRASSDATARQKEEMEVQNFVENSTEMCAVLYQYTLMLNPNEKESAELEKLAMSVVTLLDKISKQ